MAIFLGIDGGGSKTTCLIGDEQSVLGSGSAGGSNVIRVGEESTHAALDAAIRQACTVAGLEPSDINRACLGASGAGRAATREALGRGLARLLCCEIEIVADTEIALHAAFGPGPGVIVIAGTGAIACGRNARAESARASGWGFAISDDGSGYWIGREALRIALRAYDQGETPPLLRNLMHALGAATHEQLVIRGNAADFAPLLPAVLAAADSGDPLALGVLNHAGRELATSASVVLHRLFSPGETAPVAMVGGVFRNSTLVRQVFYNEVSSEFPGATVEPNVIEPVHGALDLARRGGRGAI